MPAGFDACRKGGGRIRTMSGPNKKFGLGAGQFMRVCFNDSGMHRGEVRTKQRQREVAKGKRG